MIDIKMIPHDSQRYETVGDYWQDGETLNVRISQTQDDFAALVLIHELVEALLCRKAGVQIADIDAFDMAYEANRPEGDESEPGDDSQAPYYAQHQTATRIEREVAKALGVDWEQYSQALLSLSDLRAQKRPLD